MANSLLTINMITREAVRLWKNSNEFIQHIDQQYDDSFAKVGDHNGKLGHQLIQYLLATHSRYKPGLVVIEKAIMTRTDRLDFLQKRLGMDFLVETFFESRGIPVEGVTLQAIKREVTGKSNAEKDALVAVARKCGLDLPDGPGAKDASDAFGAWLCGLRTVDKAASARWDRAVWSPKGALL